MKPTEILRRYKGSISLIDDCVLEIIFGFEGPITVQKVVLRCQASEVASPATVHKSINILMSEGLLRTAKVRGEYDNRKHWLEPTPAASRRAKEWA
jgi:Fe2+ or Zn2+ uptake regulation protein